MSPVYESFFGFVERPFSLTPDPKYFYRSRSHGRALETLTFALRSRERFMVVTGDLGLGKTVLCRTLMEQLRRRDLVSYVASPLLDEASLVRLLLEDFGAVTPREVRHGQIVDASIDELHGMLVEFFSRMHSRKSDAVVVVDEAHLMPRGFVAQLRSLAALELNGEKLVQVVLVGQAVGEPGRLGFADLDAITATKVRLLPLGREECGAYVAHRMTIAGGTSNVGFSARALELIFALSGGVPRLVNLLCERALQEAAAAGSHKVEPAMVDRAASALELLRTRPRRFRWFNRRVS